MTHADTQAVEPAIADENANADGISDESLKPTQDADTAPAADDTGEADAPEKKSGVQQRIDELTRGRRSAEREADYWRDLAMRNAQQDKKPDEPALVNQPVKTLADFEYDEAKFASYLREQSIGEAKRAALEEIKRERTEQDKRDKLSAWNDRVQKFSADVEDFQDVAFNPRLAVSDAMTEVIMSRDDGPALIYYLGKNPDKSVAIAQLPPVLAAYELGAISARLAVDSAKPKPIVSKAPPPVPKLEPMEAAVSVKTTDASGDSLSDDDWYKLEKKRLAKKRT